MNRSEILTGLCNAEFQLSILVYFLVCFFQVAQKSHVCTLTEMVGDAGIWVTRQIKQALDPKGIMNPGKVIH